MIQTRLDTRHDRAAWADDTRERILETAERLFAEHGLEGVSLREITREADVNIAAIHYHYGSRDGLVRAVLDRVVVPLNRMRLEMLDRALDASGGRPVAVEVLIEAFIRPDLVAIEELRNGRGVTVARFLGRTYSQPTPLVRQIMTEQFAVVGTRFVRELSRSLPHVPPEEIQWRLWCVVGMLVSLFAQATPRGVAGPYDTGDVDGTLARIVAFVEPGLAARAPTAKRPRRRSRR
jgi:AcrR family transcriptional regulator